MTSEATSLGERSLFSTPTRREANDFGRCLGYLNYEAVLADAEEAADACKDALAIVVGELDDDLSKVAAELHEAREDTPLICYPEATSTCPELAEGHSWALDLPLRRSQLVRLLQRAGALPGR